MAAPSGTSEDGFLSVDHAAINLLFSSRCLGYLGWLPPRGTSIDTWTRGFARGLVGAPHWLDCGRRLSRLKWELVGQGYLVEALMETPGAAVHITPLL